VERVKEKGNELNFRVNLLNYRSFFIISFWSLPILPTRIRTIYGI